MKTAAFALGICLIACLLVIIIAPVSQAQDFHVLTVKNHTNENIAFKIVKTDNYEAWFYDFYDGQEFEIEFYKLNKEMALPMLGGTFYVKFRLGDPWSDDCTYYKSDDFTLRDITPYDAYRTLLTITLTLKRDISGSLSWHLITKSEYDN